MTSTFAGFSEEDLERIKSGVVIKETKNTNPRRIQQIGLKSKRISGHSVSLQKQASDETDLDFEQCKLSICTPTSPGSSVNMINEQKVEDSSKYIQESNIEQHYNESGRKISTNITPDVIRLDNYIENEMETHKVKLEELQLRQKLMEEQNKRRKEMLARALADRTKQTEEEVQKLEKIKKELQVLDGQFSQDVAVLRKKIDQACLCYSEAEKHYLRVEKEFLQAKINLQKEKEKKELLTEHLCALITHNETRKAQKLETLMLELANDKNNAINGMVNAANDDFDVSKPSDDVPEIIDGVDQKTGKMLEMYEDELSEQ
ncbi:unnamed protein product [Leptosia nina]|uniref:RAB6-interacting golgin n=1 Tax=Leptosia nina TaxID=320188 RepID=A0AAV1JQF7_9NEOP